MSREAEEYRISSDIKEANNEVLRGRLEQAEHYLAYFVDNEENHEENLAQRHIMHEEARQFLASQQGEQSEDQDIRECETCKGTGEIDNRLGGWRTDGISKCDDCDGHGEWIRKHKHPEQAEGAQGEREAGCCCPPIGFSGAWAAGPCPVHMGLSRAALAQPSPAEDMSAAQELAGVKAILNDMADALKRLTFHARTTGGTAGPDAALMNACERAERILSLGGMGAAFMRGCDEHESQPSPAAPELEAPTSVGVLILGGAVSSTELGDNDVTLDGQVVERIQRELVSDSEDVAVELMIVGQHYRILQALRADRDNARRTAEYWKAEHLAANAALDAAQARVAELTAELRNLLHNLYGYEGFGSEVKGAMGSAKDALSRADNATVAQAGQVPEGKIVVSEEPLRRLLHALSGEPHLIRELQATRHPAALFKDNPINVLVAEYNAAPPQGGE